MLDVMCKVRFSEVLLSQPFTPEIVVQRLYSNNYDNRVDTPIRLWLHTLTDRVLLKLYPTEFEEYPRLVVRRIRLLALDKKDGWMTCNLTSSSNSISVISGR